MTDLTLSVYRKDPFGHFSDLLPLRQVGKLHLVDLAGAESAARSGVLGERLDEAKNINKSPRGQRGVEC